MAPDRRAKGYELNLGDSGLWLTIGLAALGFVLARRPSAAWLIVGSAVVATGCTGRLLIAMASNDLGFSYVADHTRPGVSPWLRAAGLWAGAEGSLLLWVTMVAWAAVAALSYSKSVWVIRASSGLVVGYGATLALTASPFERLDVPAVAGLGLQPVLEHPAMIWHPPLLYAGLTSMLVPGLVALAPTLTRDPSASCRPSIQPGFTLPLVLLGAGLVTGAMWANVELGWGGYWAWDPIESAGLVAWMLAAAALHCTAGGGGFDTAKSDQRHPTSVAVLLVAPGIAALWATTLTRIGVINSVHAFADRPRLRVGLLLVVGTSSLVVAGRLLMIRRTGQPLAWSRALAVALLVTAGALIALGTYEPMIEAATTGDSVAIAGRFFARVLWPVVVVASMAAAWADRKQCSPRWLSKHTLVATLGAVAGALVVPLRSGLFGLVLAASGGLIAGSALAVGLHLRGRHPVWGRTVAHVGMGVLVVGVAGTMATRSDVVVAELGEAQQVVGGLEVTHRGIVITQSASISEAKATVEVNGSVLHPRLVSFPLRSASTAEVGSRYDTLDQIQVVLIDGDQAQALYRVNHLPRLGLVWLGAATIIVGLGIGSWRRNKTSRAPATA